MNSLVLLILGMILLNSVIQLIPLLFPDLDPGLYIPYQFWINILLIFNWLLPARKGLYLFKKRDENIVDGGEAVLASSPDDTSTTHDPSLDSSEPSAPPI